MKRYVITTDVSYKNTLNYDVYVRVIWKEDYKTHMRDQRRRARRRASGRIITSMTTRTMLMHK